MASDNRYEPRAEPIRYPDPDIKALDQRFQKYVLGNAAIERIAGGCRFTEGPVWFGDGRYLLWSDIPNDRIMKWEEETGAVSVCRRPSNYANGNTRDRQGRLVTCERDAQRLTRTEYDGTITVLADSFEGKRLTAPNDVVVKSDGSIWFSDNGAGTRDVRPEETSAEAYFTEALDLAEEATRWLRPYPDRRALFSLLRRL